MVQSKELFLAIRAGKLSFFENGWWTAKNDVRAISLPNTFMSGLVYYFFVPGQSNHSLGIFNEIYAVRLPGAILGAFFIPTFYLLTKKHVGGKISLLSSLLLALDPVAVGTSRYLNQDSSLMVFSFVALGLFLYIPNKLFTTLSAFFTACAFLTKPQGLILVPVVFLTSLATLQKKENRQKNIPRLIWWLISSFLFIFILFPYFWHNPIDKLFGYLASNFNVSSHQGRDVFFLGRQTTNPPWYYYLVTVPFHITEPVLIGLVFFVVFLVRNPGRKFTDFHRASLLYSIIYFLIISTSSIKLGVRYFFPLWPYLLLVSGCGLIYTADQYFKRKPLKVIFICLVIATPIFWLIRFSPNYYLFYNILTSAQDYQNRETVGFCDGIKPSINYLESNHKLFHGVMLEIKYCYPPAQYFTGWTLSKARELSDKPDYVIIENSGLQTSPELGEEITKSRYQLVKEISFNNLVLTRIYSRPAF